MEEGDWVTFSSDGCLCEGHILESKLTDIGTRFNAHHVYITRSESDEKVGRKLWVVERDLKKIKKK